MLRRIARAELTQPTGSDFLEVLQIGFGDIDVIVANHDQLADRLGRAQG